MAEPVVYIVDDDELVRKTLSMLLTSVNLAVRAYANAQEFLDSYRDDAPGCLVIDIRMPGMSGLQLQEQLGSRGIDLPVIVMSGHADIETAVRSMQLGALNFLRKPFKHQAILEEVNRCIARHTEAWQARQARSGMRDNLESLTAREREILAFLVKGTSSKEIGTALAISFRTVEAHRRSILAKFRVRSVFELVQQLRDHGYQP
jgi:two-component system, LuxR family, response regulator FixJ